MLHAPNLVFGFRGDVPYHISQVQSGLKCACHLLDAPDLHLNAKKGTIKQHHFAMESGAHITAADINRTNETAVHKKAKVLLSEGGLLKLPASSRVLDGFTVSSPAVDINFCSSDIVCEVSEYTSTGIRYVPDAVISSFIRLLLEIKVWHASESTAKMQMDKKYGVEVTVPLDVFDAEQGADFDIWFKNFLLNDLNSKKWLSHPLFSEQPETNPPAICLLESLQFPAICKVCDYYENNKYYCTLLGLEQVLYLDAKSLDLKYANYLEKERLLKIQKVELHRLAMERLESEKGTKAKKIVEQESVERERIAKEEARAKMDLVEQGKVEVPLSDIRTFIDALSSLLPMDSHLHFFPLARELKSYLMHCKSDQVLVLGEIGSILVRFEACGCLDPRKKKQLQFIQSEIRPFLGKFNCKIRVNRHYVK